MNDYKSNIGYLFIYVIDNLQLQFVSDNASNNTIISIGQKQIAVVTTYINPITIVASKDRELKVITINLADLVPQE